MTSTNLLDWRVVTNSPEDGQLRTNYLPVVPQRYYWLVKVPILGNSNNVVITNN